MGRIRLHDHAGANGRHVGANGQANGKITKAKKSRTDFSGRWDRAILDGMLLDLTGPELRVLTALRKFANWKTGVCFPSLKTIARLTYRTGEKSVVKRALVGLKKKGRIKTIVEGSFRGSTIRLLLPPVEKVGAEEAPTVGAQHTPTVGAAHAPTVGAEDTPTVGAKSRRRVGATDAPLTPNRNF